jgi:hypothetical protein
MLTVVQDADEANGNEAGQRSLLDEIDRDGARQMLAAAWQAEVAAYVEQFADQRDDNGPRLVLRNGYHQPREVLTTAAAVEVTAPRVNAVSIPRPVSDSGSPRRSSRPGRKGQFHHRVIGKRPRHTEKSVWMLWSCACTRPIAFVMRRTPQMRAARAA